MKMISGGLKSISVLVIGWLTYLNDTFSPLFWILLALVALDLVFNAHKDGKQFEKIGSMAMSLGLPSWVTANLGSPYLGKYVVAILCIAYIRMLVPQLLDKAAKFQFSKDPKQNAYDEAAIQAFIEKAAQAEILKAQAQAAASKEPSKAQAQAAASKEPSIIKDTPSVAPQSTPAGTE